MQDHNQCESWEKPTKNERFYQPINWARLKFYPDSDVKRVSYCKEHAEKAKRR